MLKKPLQIDNVTKMGRTYHYKSVKAIVNISNISVLGTSSVYNLTE